MFSDYNEVVKTITEFHKSQSYISIIGYIPHKGQVLILVCLYDQMYERGRRKISMEGV